MSAQTFRPGFVDPRPVLEAAERAIGVDRLRCVTLAGTGYAGIVGQQRLAEKNVDWPREPLTTYRRTMDWEAETMIEEIEPTAPESRVEIHLAVSAYKSDKLDLVVQKAVELGVTSLSPIVTARGSIFSICGRVVATSR